MTKSCVLIVEPDILIRNPVAEYLRECGYQVLEAADAAEARTVISDGSMAVDIVLADIDMPGEGGFALAAWIRADHAGIEVILTGSVAKAAEKAGDLCQEGPALTKPYDHQVVLNKIRRSLAARDRAGTRARGPRKR
jgi:DNA-binding response OmpR family regulator